MSLFAHTITVLMLVFLSSEVAAIAGSWTQQLKLPGCSIATFTPILVLSAYLLSVILEKTSKWSRLTWVLVGLFMVYPAVIFKAFSHSIVRPNGFTSTDFKRFKSEFGVPAIAVNDRITVAARDFRPEMVTRLREMSALSDTKTEQAVSSDGQKPSNSESSAGPTTPADAH
jgi:hypothetical protein